MKHFLDLGKGIGMGKVSHVPLFFLLLPLLKLQASWDLAGPILLLRLPLTKIALQMAEGSGAYLVLLSWA